MLSTRLFSHREFRPRAFSLVVALCLGLSSFGGSLHYVLDHSVAHGDSSCDASPGTCLDTDCNDSTHSDAESHCAVCLSLARSLGKAVVAAAPPTVNSMSSPDTPVALPTARLPFRSASQRGPPALV
jgi:hypothetical protein